MMEGVGRCIGKGKELLWGVRAYALFNMLSLQQRGLLACLDDGPTVGVSVGLSVLSISGQSPLH